MTDFGCSEVKVGLIWRLAGSVYKRNSFVTQTSMALALQMVIQSISRMHTSMGESEGRDIQFKYASRLQNKMQ